MFGQKRTSEPKVGRLCEGCACGWWQPLPACECGRVCAQKHVVTARKRRWFFFFLVIKSSHQPLHENTSTPGVQRCGLVITLMLKKNHNGFHNQNCHSCGQKLKSPAISHDRCQIVLLSNRIVIETNETRFVKEELRRRRPYFLIYKLHEDK